MTSELNAATRALALATVEIERHVGTRGWDGPIAVFSLVRSSRIVATSPELADQLPEGAAEDPEHLTSIEQDGLPEADTLEDLLAQLAWPETVDGAAIVVERMVVPPEAEADMPSDPEEGLAYLMAHPERQDMRIAVGVLRSGDTWCALRSRANDSDDAVAGGPDAVPGLAEALASTLR
ncbi:PPA1309 family protein [Ruania alba]|nr:PPA1309 family protein [Ruania alba]